MNIKYISLRIRNYDQIYANLAYIVVRTLLSYWVCNQNVYWYFWTALSSSARSLSLVNCRRCQYVCFRPGKLSTSNMIQQLDRNVNVYGL